VYGELESTDDRAKVGTPGTRANFDRGSDVAGQPAVIRSGTRLTTRIQSPADEVWNLVGSDLSAITTWNSEYLRRLLDEASSR